jgi:hypothetical protein
MVEYMAGEKVHFDAADRNADGSLDKAEQMYWLFPGDSGAYLKMQTKYLINLSDANRDGKLSFDEMNRAGPFYHGELHDPSEREL